MFDSILDSIENVPINVPKRLDDILDCIEKTQCNHKIHRVLELLTVNCKWQSIEKESNNSHFKVRNHAINASLKAKL